MQKVVVELFDGVVRDKGRCIGGDGRKESTMVKKGSGASSRFC